MIRSLMGVFLGCTENISKWPQSLLGLKGTIPLLFQLLKASYSLRLMVPIFKAGDISTSVTYALI